jgi:hypothetical protein
MRCRHGDRASRRHGTHDSSSCCRVSRRSRGRMTGSRMASSRVASSRMSSSRCMTGRSRVSGGSCMTSYSRVSSSSRVPGNNSVPNQEVRRQHSGAEGHPQSRVRRAILLLLLLLDTGVDVGLE